MTSLETAPALAEYVKLPQLVVAEVLEIAKEMLRRTGVPQGLIACAHGGTSMAQWSPKLKRLGGDSLYGARNNFV